MVMGGGVIRDILDEVGYIFFWLLVKERGGRFEDKDEEMKAS